MQHYRRGDDPQLDKRIDAVASMIYAAALAFTNTIGRKGWSWEACDENTREYWRKIAALSRDVFLAP